jgi:hypothetical protein
MTIRRMIRQEIIAREPEIVGKVLQSRSLMEFDGSSGGSPVWVVDVDIGGDKILKNVPVKGGSGMRRAYANIGQTVMLRRNALGRFDIVSPGDRVAGISKGNSYDLTTGAATAQPDQGFVVGAEPYSFYQGPEVIADPAETMQFALVGGGNDTLTRSGPGSWTLQGFVAPKWILVAGSVSNDGYYGPIVAASATILQFAGDVFVNEGPSVGITVGHTSLWTQANYPARSTRNAQGEIVT